MTPWNKKGGCLFQGGTTHHTCDSRLPTCWRQVGSSSAPEVAGSQTFTPCPCLHRRASNTASKPSLSLPGAQNLSNLRFPKTLRTRKKWVQEDFRHFNVKILRRTHLVPSGMSSGRRCGAKSRPTGRKLTPRCGIFGLLWVFWSRQGCPQR